MLSDTTLRNLNVNVERLDKLQNQLTSGKRISAPSDDPIGAASAIEFRAILNQIEQYIKNADSSISWLGATDSALDSVGGMLQRARELAVQGATDSLTTADKQRIAIEVEQLLENTIQVANSTYGTHYLLAGFKTNAPPFSPVGNPPSSVIYSGDNGQIQRQIDKDASVTVNVSGSVLSQVFTTLISLRDALNIGEASAISAKLTDIDAAIDSIVAARSEVGARINRITDQKSRLESLVVNISDILSKTEDVDMTKAISDFALQQNVYKAALAAGAKAIQPSLMDYLR